MVGPALPRGLVEAAMIAPRQMTAAAPAAMTTHRRLPAAQAGARRSLTNSASGGNTGSTWPSTAASHAGRLHARIPA
ncbi:hypothetical protein G6F31_020980 [Rhizopus arrhizus]|nr:hypothetical protein G6F31_020980 [Rhizopus arrhizus]